MSIRATFDGWELALGDAPGAENAWSTEPRDGEGLLVDAAVAVSEGVRSVCLVRAAVPAKALAALVARVEALALLDCTLAGGFDEAAASGLQALWIHGPRKLASKVLTPLGRASGLDTLHLDGVAPPALFRWLAPLVRLRRLDLSRPDGDGDLGRGLAALKPLAQLEQLGVRRASITDTVLAQIAALPALRRLDLSYGTLSATARTWRKLRHVEVLRLRGIRGYWVPHIANVLWEMDGLREVDLRGQHVPPPVRDSLRVDFTAIRFLLDPLPQVAPAAGTPRTAPAAVPSPPAYPEPPLPETWLEYPDGAPALKDLYVVIDDERGHPIGYDRRYDLAAIAARYHPRQLVESLGAPLDAEPLLVALTLLVPVLQRFDPNANRFVDAAIARLAGLLDDTRAVGWTWASSQAERFIVGRAASAALVGLLHWRANRRRAPIADDIALLDTVLRAELRRDGGEPYLVTAHLADRTREPGFPGALSAWLDTMTATLDDANAPPRARIAALERLSRDVDGFMGTLPEPTTTVWRRTLHALARHAVSPATEMRFRRAARKLVAERAPEIFDAMRAAGEIASRALPDYAQLVDGIGRPDPARVLPVAPDVDGATCIAALRADDVEAWFPALALAPYCGDAAEMRTLAELATGLVGRRDRVELDAPHSRQSALLGDIAADALTRLVRERRVPRDGLFERLLAKLAAEPVETNLTTPPGLREALEATAPADGDAVLLQRFLDRGTPAAERFLLMLLSFPIRRDHAQRVLEDPSEDGDLRALVGCLSGLEQPAGAAPLPLIEPYATTLDNALASLAVGRHPVSVRRAVAMLVGLLLPWGKEETHADGARTLQRLPPPPSLRAIVDGDDDFGREAAARWLAVLGAQEDEGRIARAMLAGTWTATRPQGRILTTPIERLMAALVDETVVDYCDSDFDPLLVIGYGESGAARIRAKAYTLIARRHADAGRLPFARRSMEYAAQLDPMNLDVARLRRTLGD